MSSKLYYWYGAMGAGKSIELIKAAYNYKNRGMLPMVFNFANDERFGKGKVSSRSGIGIESISFDNNTIFNKELAKFILENKAKPNCIFIDESQFLSKEQVNDILDIAVFESIPIMCYGLKTNFKSELFEGSKRLLEVAHSIEEIKTICWCERKATMNARVKNGKVVDEGKELEIGGDESYISLCMEHYLTKQLS